MKIKSLITVLVVLLITLSSHSQDKKIFMPGEFQRAYENGTRAYDGNPGSEYWQNSSGYRIKAKIDPETLTLYGEEVITYNNNSPDSLRYLVIKLLQDVYKKGSARDMSLGPDIVNEGIKLTELIIGEDSIDVTQPSRRFGHFGTNMYVLLNSKLGQGDNIELTIHWNYQLPYRFGMRTGAYDSTSFFVGYWYPQIAVYDDIDGWDMNSYTGIQETYNDFADYEVEITMPDSYFVWATGDLQNENDILNNNILKRMAESRSSDEVVNRIGKQPVPVDLKVTFDDDSIEEIYETAGIWKDQKGKAKFHLDTKKKVKKIELGNGGIPDVNQVDNVWIAK